MNLKGQLFIITLVALAATAVAAQLRRGCGAGVGRVIDAALDTPVEYANVVLCSRADSAQVTGAMTDARGRFRLTSIRPGAYFLAVRFIGYQPGQIESIEIERGGQPVRLGTIALRQTVLNLEGAEAVAERAPVEYHIDKRVINVGRQYTAASGIINLVMKKGRLRGNSGVVNMNAGLDDKRGGDFLMQVRRRFFNAFIGADYNKRIFPGSAVENNSTTTQNIRSFVSAEGTRSRGLLLKPGRGNELEIGMRYGDRTGERRAKLDYDQWSDLDPRHFLFLSRDGASKKQGHLTPKLSMRPQRSVEPQRAQRARKKNRRFYLLSVWWKVDLKGINPSFVRMAPTWPRW